MKIRNPIFAVLLITIVVGSTALYVINNPTADAGVVHVIERVDRGYIPEEVIIAVGDTVRFTNSSSQHHWPASDIHPTHGIYPEFDPDRPLAPGEDWEFTFTEEGSWRFHDHQQANRTGIIYVE